jgi:hypothetical protein
VDSQQNPRLAEISRPLVPGDAGTAASGVSFLAAEKLLVLTLASSAGVHGALVPAHAAEAPLLGAMFALSALLLAGTALRIDRAPGGLALAAAAVLLAALLAAYVATRFVALPPVPHAEPVDLLGAATKLIEAGGLVLALRLLGTRAGGGALPALHEGAGR